MEIAHCEDNATMTQEYITSEPNVLVIISVILSVFAVFTILANVTVVIGVFKALQGGNTSKENKIAKMLMASMGLSDILFGAVLMPFSIFEIINNGKWTLGYDMCAVRLGISHTMTGVAMYHILCMALDKFLAICKPLRYRVLSGKSAYFMISLSWICPTAFVNVPLNLKWAKYGVKNVQNCYEVKQLCHSVVNHQVLSVIFTAVFYVPLTITYLLYFCVLRDIHNFNKRKHNLRKPGPLMHDLGIDWEAGELSQKMVSTISPEQMSSRAASTNESLNISTVGLENEPSIVKTASFNLHTSNQIALQTSIAPQTKDSSQTSANSKSFEIVIPPISSPAPNGQRNQTFKTLRQGSRNLKAFRTIGTIVLCFTLCWAPPSVVVIFYAVNNYVMPLWVLVAVYVSGYVNSSLNPFIYCANRSGRQAVKSLLCSKA